MGYSNREQLEVTADTDLLFYLLFSWFNTVIWKMFQWIKTRKKCEACPYIKWTTKWRSNSYILFEILDDMDFQAGIN